MKYLQVIVIALLSTFCFPGESKAESLDDLKYAYWKQHVPNIVICDGLTLPIEHVEMAAQSWRQRGEKIGEIVYKPCNERPNFGEIAFYHAPEIVGDAFHGKAQTSRYKGTDSLAYARVWLGHKLDSVELIEHELGHGLGYRDTYGFFSDSIMSTHSPLTY